MYPLETRIKKNNSGKFYNKLSTIVVVPPELRKVQGISFYKLMFDPESSCEHVTNVIKNLIINRKFYIVDHRNCLLKCISSCHVEEDGNIYLYVVKSNK